MIKFYRKQLFDTFFRKSIIFFFCHSIQMIWIVDYFKQIDQEHGKCWNKVYSTIKLNCAYHWISMNWIFEHFKIKLYSISAKDCFRFSRDVTKVCIMCYLSNMCAIWFACLMEMNKKNRFFFCWIKVFVLKEYF